MSVYAVIPARAGSKGVVGKNLRDVSGFPLIAYSAVAALRSAAFDKVFVSTDSAEIANVAKQYGAEVPFLRPDKLAQDVSSDRGYVEHALDFFRDKGNEPDALAIIRPTTPLRDPELIAESIRFMSKEAGQTGLRSIHPLPEPPQKMMKIEDDWLTGFFPDDPRPEYYNLPRQTFPTAYQPNGYIDVVTSKYIRSSETGIFGPRVLGFVTPYVIELDTIEEFDHLEFSVSRKPYPIVGMLENAAKNRS